MLTAERRRRGKSEHTPSTRTGPIDSQSIQGHSCSDMRCPGGGQTSASRLTAGAYPIVPGGRGGTMALDKLIHGVQ